MSELATRRVLAEAFTLDQEIKRSRFIVHACPLNDHQAHVESWLASLHQPDANHHCWAWQFDGQYRFNDDGEPSGTAGKPILMALEGSGVDRCLVVVVRYFGGIKLGAGGLARAYGGSAAECLRQAPTRLLRPHQATRIQADFNHSQALFDLQQQFDQQGAEPTFASDGVYLNILVRQDQLAELQQQLNNRCRGDAQMQVAEEIHWR
jgi:uncharacterized YigZ family protein